MEPNLFKPYKIIEQTKSYLQLAESGSRKIFLFIFFRIFPILLIFSIILTIISFDFPWFIKLGLSSIILIFLMLLAQKYSIEIDVTANEITIIKQTLFGKRAQKIKTSEIEKITVQTYWLYNGGGIYYHLVLKENHRKLSLLTIPYLYMKLKNREDINKTLETITGLKVVKW